MPDFDALQDIVGYRFVNLELLRQALVHRSYLNENPSFPLGHNERLEFLGDAVLELVVSDHLYRNYPNQEGDLTNWRASLVNAKSLSEVARALDIDQFLLLSRGESKDKASKARQNIHANTIESIIGAMYLDGGMEPARVFIEKNVLVRLPDILATEAYVDPKSRFQEMSQEVFGITPSYKVLREWGPDHDKQFEVAVNIGSEEIAVGSGASKQEAQVAAASAALKVKGWTN